MTAVYIVSFYANIIRIKPRSLITAELLNQNPTKKVILLYKNVLIRCCKWLYFQSAEYNHY